MSAGGVAVDDGAFLGEYTITNLGPGDASAVRLRAWNTAGVTFAAARSTDGDLPAER